MLPTMGIVSFSWWRRRFNSAESSPNLTDLRVAAEAGNAEAQCALGLRCCAGSGTSRDFDQGVRWYQMAADQGHALAQFQLALMFAHGQGVPRDDGMALVWIRKAAEGGNAGAQFNLGSKCHRASLLRGGMDPIEPRTEAYKWFRLAASQGFKDSVAAWERMALGMSREEVTEGNQRVAAFVVRKATQSSRVLTPAICE